MPFDGNGNWTADFSAVTDKEANIKIMASRFDNIHQADLKESFENCLTKDMQVKPLQPFNANNFRVINVANPVQDTDAVNLQTFNTSANSKISAKVPNSVGSGVKHVYTNGSGVITASSSTVGTASTPVYMTSGTITVCTGSMGAPKWSGLISVSSGWSATNNGWIRVRHRENKTVTITIAGKTAYNHQWSGGDYGTQYQVSFMPIAKGDSMTTSGEIDSLQFVPNKV